MAEEKKDFSVDEWIDQDKDRKRKMKLAKKKMTMKEYLELLKQDPFIAQNSAARLLEAVLDCGTSEIPESERFWRGDISYNLFSKYLFGIDKAIANVVDHIKAGANNLSVGKQILLLLGPPASGKSTFVNVLKKALEHYSNRPVFRIAGCPMFEEPLHLLPPYKQEEIAKVLGIKVEGDLCPVCRAKLFKDYRDADGVMRWWDVEVESMSFSIQGRRGIGSFEPADDKTSDISQLVGHENISVTATRGVDDPEAYSLTGELNVANLGICEGIEFVKNKEEMLWVFLSVAQEKVIKVQGSPFPHISVDLVVIGHTNFNEFKRFAGEKKGEALHNRIYVVHFPYPLRIKDEVRIYRKLIETESDFIRLKKCHIAPYSLELAALFSVLTRLNASGNVDILTKAKLYNDEIILTRMKDREKNPIDVRTLYKDGQKDPDVSKREGMHGVSSRNVLAAINNAMVKKTKGCLTPLKVLVALREYFDHSVGYSPEEIKYFQELLSSSEKGSVMTEFKDFVKTSVEAAFLSSYGDVVKGTFDRYVQHLILWATKSYPNIRKIFGITSEDEEEKDPDFKFMRMIEDHAGISEQESRSFRSEVLMAKGAIQSQNRDFDLETYPPLGEAARAYVLGQCQGILSVVLSEDKAKTEEEKVRLANIFSDLEKRGFCKVCAKELVEKAREYL